MARKRTQKKTTKRTLECLYDGPHMLQLGKHIVPHVSTIIYIDNISLVFRVSNCVFAFLWVRRSAHINLAKENALANWKVVPLQELLLCFALSPTLLAKRNQYEAYLQWSLMQFSIFET